MSFYKEYIKEHNGLFIISFTLWLSAVFIGMYIAFSSDKALAEEIRQYIVSSVGGKHSFASVFKNGVITNFKYSLALIISSMSVVFLPAAAFLIAFKGFSAGFTSMFLIKLYGLSGLGTSLTAVVIPLVFSLPGGVYNFGAENSMNTYETTCCFCEMSGEGAQYVVPDYDRFPTHERNISISGEKIFRASGGAICFPSTLDGFRLFLDVTTR